MSAFYLRPAMLIFVATFSAVAAAQTSPLGPIGRRPFERSAQQVGLLKGAEATRASGVSAPTRALSDGIRRDIDSRARERIVRLSPVTPVSDNIRRERQKQPESSQPLPEKLIATRMAPISLLSPDVSIAALRPVPDVQPEPPAVQPSPRRLENVPIRPVPVATAEPAKAEDGPSESMNPEIYRSMPPTFAFRETRPFIGMRDLRAAAFEKAPAATQAEAAQPAAVEHVSKPVARKTEPHSSPAAVVRRLPAPKPVTEPAPGIPQSVSSDPSAGFQDELASLVDHRAAGATSEKKTSVTLTGPVRPRKSISQSPVSGALSGALSGAVSPVPGNHNTAGIVRLASSQPQSVDESQGVLLAVPPLPPADEHPIRSNADSGTTGAFDGVEIFNPIYAVTLGSANIEAHNPPDQLPTNQARQLQGFQEPQYQWASGHSMYSPNRNAYPICYRPLYFEDPNLERCGQAHGCLTELVSIAHFAGRIPVLPYMMVAEPPHDCVAAKPDCPMCSSFGPDAYFPRPDEVDLGGVAVQAAATVGLIFLLP
ncbi:MAG: hypothetical protein R3C19_26300 [Planctomycetaceae bacterium]